MSHLLELLELEIHTADEAEARRLQERLSRLHHQALEGVLSRVLDPLSPPGLRHQLERLELDLGAIPADQLERLPPQRLERALRQALPSRLRTARVSRDPDTPEPAPSPVSRVPPRQAETSNPALSGNTSCQRTLELLADFAATGTLPWWHPRHNARLLPTAFDAALRLPPTVLAPFLRQLTASPAAQQRLLASLDPDQRPRLLEAPPPPLAPADAGWSGRGQPQAGTDGETSRGINGRLRLSLGPAEADAVLAVVASKWHNPGPLANPDAPGVASATVLQPLVAQLTPPDPERRLALVTTRGGSVLVGGEPGTFYTLQRPADGATVGAPMYVPQRTSADPPTNWGLGWQRLNRDMVVASEAGPGFDGRPHVDELQKAVVVARRAFSGTTIRMRRKALVVIPLNMGVMGGNVARILVFGLAPEERISLLSVGSQPPPEPISKAGVKDGSVRLDIRGSVPPDAEVSLEISQEGSDQRWRFTARLFTPRSSAP